MNNNYIKSEREATSLQEKNVSSNYQVITITVRQKASKVGSAVLILNNRRYSVDFTEKSLFEDTTINVLYEYLRRQLDVYYIVTRTKNGIRLESVFADGIEEVSFDGGATGILAETGVTSLRREKSYNLSQPAEQNQVIVIDEEYDFGGDTFVVPANSVLQFQGGCIKNARIKYDNTTISGACNIVNCICTGRLANTEVTPEMFGARSLNFTDTLYDISLAIQNSLDSGNYNVVVNNETGTQYEWRNTVNLFDSSITDFGDDANAHRWNVCIRGSVSAPVVRVGSEFGNHTIIIYTGTAFRCTNQNYDFSSIPWPRLYLLNLDFVFSYNLSVHTTFIEGMLHSSRLEGLNVCNCYRFINGGLKVTSLVANCFVEACEYVFGGSLGDSKIESCYFTAFRRDEDIEPVFYMNSIECCNSNKVAGVIDATIFSNNYIDYFYDIFVMSDSWMNCIRTYGNTFDIFKYYAVCRYWRNGVIKERTDYAGCVIISNGDVFRRCNNLPDPGDDVPNSQTHSTDHHLRYKMKTYLPNKVPRNNSYNGSKYEFEIYSIFGKIMNYSAFQVNSFIDQTNDYVFAKKTAERDTDAYPITITEADAKFTSGPSFAFSGSANIHSGEFICGGRPSMYPFSHLSSSTNYLSQGTRFRRPELKDLQDMGVTTLPTTQLFHGRRVLYNNEICTFRQLYANTINGQWVNPQGVVRGTVS